MFVLLKEKTFRTFPAVDAITPISIQTQLKTIYNSNLIDLALLSRPP
jgi:hypothetical protein